MTSRLCIAGFAGSLTFAACAATAPRPQAPTHPAAKAVVAEEPLEVTQPSPLALYRSADAVAHVKIVSSRATLVPGRGPMPSVFTVFEANVLDAAKGTLPAHIKVYQKAGQVEDANRIYRVDDLEPVKADDEYLLFINWNSTLGAYVVAGSEGAYEINAGGRLRALAHTNTAAEVGARTLNAVKNDIRIANSDLQNGVKK